MKITPIIYSHRPDARGNCPIVIRIHIDGKRIFRPTDESVPATSWKKGVVIRSYPNAELINSKIEKAISEIKAELLKEQLQDNVVTAEVVKKKFAPKVKQDFYKVCEQMIITWKGKKKDSTLSKYTHELSKLKKYAPYLQFSDVNVKWLGEYEAYQREKLGNTSNTVWRSFKNLKTFFNTAIKQGVIKDYPFAQYDNPTYKNGSREHLTANELPLFVQALESGKVIGADIIAGWFFVFSCYTGLRYSDCEQFSSKKHIIEDKRILLNMVKTEEDVSMIITPKIREALNQIANYEGKMPTNQECNRAVKAIAKKAGINKLLTFHCARHTFGFSCAEANMPIEVCAKLMGHTNAKTTAVYYHISNSNADQWMMKLHS